MILIKEILSSLKGEVSILPHRYADIDAIVSGEVVRRFLERNGVKAYLYSLEGLNYSADFLVKKYGIEVKKVEEEELRGEIIVVDTHSLELAKVMEGKEAFLIIDHHEKSGSLIKAKNYVIDKEAVATAQIVYEGLRDDLEEEDLELIGIAFISDTFRFKRFDRKSARLFSEILEKIDKEYEELLKFAFPKKSKEIMEIYINAIKKAEFIEIEDYVVGYTETEDSTGEIASILTNFCDLAVVFKRRENASSFSLRCDDFFEIELNKMAEEIAKRLGGAGGGHKKAAGAIIPLPLEEAKDKVIEEVKSYLINFNKR